LRRVAWRRLWGKGSMFAAERTPHLSIWF